MASGLPHDTGWARIARRIRVPLGFVLAVAYLGLARPAWASLAAGAAVVLPGLWLRAVASGYVEKSRALTTSGPYAYTRNPLYLGSVIIALGFGIAARSLVLAAAMIVMFLAIYLPVIRFEEKLLRELFPAEFDDYARRVPRLLPRLRAAPGPVGAFSRALYLRHREYNASVGAAAVLLALVVKLVWFPG